MDRKTPKPPKRVVQIEPATYDRMVRYLQTTRPAPTQTALASIAIDEWIDRAEAELVENSR